MSCGCSVDVHQTSTEHQFVDVLGIKNLMYCGSLVDVPQAANIHRRSTGHQLFDVGIEHQKIDVLWIFCGCPFDVLGIKSLIYYGSFVDLQDLFLIFFNAPLPTPPIPRGPHNFSQLASRAIDSLKYGFINSLFTFSLHLFLICNYWQTLDPFFVCAYHHRWLYRR